MIELTNDSEIFSATRHSVELFDDFENWTKVGAVEDSPTFETFHITADQAFTGKSMSASVAWSSRSKILAVDSLESKWEKADKLPRNHVSEVVKTFCEKRAFKPEYFVIMNVVEESAWRAFIHVSNDGYIKPEHEAFQRIMGTWVGKMAAKIGEIKSIEAIELSKANNQGATISEGPSFIFELKVRLNDPRRFGGAVRQQ